MKKLNPLTLLLLLISTAVFSQDKKELVLNTDEIEEISVKWKGGEAEQEIKLSEKSVVFLVSQINHTPLTLGQIGRSAQQYEYVFTIKLDGGDGQRELYFVPFKFNPIIWEKGEPFAPRYQSVKYYYIKADESERLLSKLKALFKSEGE